MTSKAIALIAHDRMKPNLVAFLKERESWLWGRKLLATGLTADFVEQGGIKADVEHLSPGKLGGYAELTKRVEQGDLGMVLFFRDADIVQDYERDVVEFLKACNRNNIPLATNPASAELLILGQIKLEMGDKGRSRNVASSNH
ncbi:MAG: methylglyoxal synthase [Flavobacteriales bacterium]|jgi:methylglyoxal synthase